MNEIQYEEQQGKIQPISKNLQPRMKHGLFPEPVGLSVYIRVHPWLNYIFQVYPNLANRASTRSAIFGKGTTSSTAPCAMASRGMPNTTQLASSWASVAAVGVTTLVAACGNPGGNMCAI